MTTDSNGVYAALAAAQAEYPAVPKLHTATVRGEDKNGNPITYTYKYADLADIMTVIQPVLSRHGLAVTQPIELRENGTLALRTSVVHGDGSAIHSMVPLPMPTAKPQAFGSALTFMRRYAYTALVGIATEEDDDGTAAEQPGEVTRVSTKPPKQALQAAKANGNGRAKSPAEEVDAAIDALRPPYRVPVSEPSEEDPWAINGQPIDLAMEAILLGIRSRPGAEVKTALAIYTARLGFTEHEQGLIDEALGERLKAAAARKAAQTHAETVS